MFFITSHTFLLLYVMYFFSPWELIILIESHKHLAGKQLNEVFQVASVGPEESEQ